MDNLRVMVTISTTGTRGSQWDTPYLKLEAGVVTVDENGQITNPDSYGPEAGYQDFSLTAQANLDDDGPEADGKLYAFTAGFRGFMILDQQRLDRMSKVLRSVNRRMAKAEQTRGYTTDPVEHLVRFADALGIKADRPFVRKTGGHGGMYADNSYAFMSGYDLALWFPTEADKARANI